MAQEKRVQVDGSNRVVSAIIVETSSPAYNSFAASHPIVTTQDTAKGWLHLGNGVFQAPALTPAQIDAELDAIADSVMTNRGALKAFALVMLDEINELRADHGRPAYTATQLRAAVRSRIG